MASTIIPYPKTGDEIKTTDTTIDAKVDSYRVVTIFLTKDNVTQQVFCTFEKQKERERVLDLSEKCKELKSAALMGVQFGTRNIVYTYNTSGSKIIISEEIIPDETIYIPNKQDQPEGQIDIVNSDELSAIIGTESEWCRVRKEVVEKNPTLLHYVHDKKVIFSAEKFTTIDELKEEPVL